MFSSAGLSIGYHVGEESVTSIHLCDEFYANLLFDRSIFRPMCTHMGYCIIGTIVEFCLLIALVLAYYLISIISTAAILVLVKI